MKRIEPAKTFDVQITADGPSIIHLGTTDHVLRGGNQILYKGGSPSPSVGS